MTRDYAFAQRCMDGRFGCAAGWSGSQRVRRSIASSICGVAEANLSRSRNRDGVAGLESGGQSRDQRGRSAAGQHDAVGISLDIASLLVLKCDAIAQLRAFPMTHVAWIRSPGCRLDRLAPRAGGGLISSRLVR